ncbi:MAG: hypothetical protein V1803_02020 [Candidatus Roizmanbacteria bacterium]
MMPLLRKIVDYGIWVLFFVFFTISLLFYATKDSVPGDWLFGTKLGLEKALIATSALLNKQVDLQIDFVARRYREMSKVLASKYGLESLLRLDNQIAETGNSITNIKDPTKRKEAATRYIAELSFISAGLEQKQQNYSYSPPPPSQNQPIDSPEPTNISNQIDNTQETIQKTIDEMNRAKLQNNIIEPTDIPTSTPEIVISPTVAPAPETFQEPTPTTVQDPIPTTQTDIPSSTPAPTAGNPHGNDEND